MNTEIEKIMAPLQDAYNGDPWFGRSVKSLIADIKEFVHGVEDIS